MMRTMKEFSLCNQESILTFDEGIKQELSGQKSGYGYFGAP